MAFWAQGFWKPGFWKDGFWSGMGGPPAPAVDPTSGAGWGHPGASRFIGYNKAPPVVEEPVEFLEAIPEVDPVAEQIERARLLQLNADTQRNKSRREMLAGMMTQSQGEDRDQMSEVEEALRILMGKLH